MSDYLLAVCAGILQGLTEFLPISSSGHLVILHEFFGFNLADDLFFDVTLHLATLIALVLYFRKDIVKMIKAFLNSFFNWNLKNDVNQRISWFIIIGTIPAVSVGFLFESEIETIFRNSVMVAIMLMVFGLLLYFTDRFCQKSKDMSNLSFYDSVIIGLAQAFALIPGVSRSGITIIAGLNQKMKRIDAARYAFLLGLPAIFAATVRKLFSSYHSAWQDIDLLIIGFICAGLTGFFTIKYFLKFIEKHSLKVFAYYRIILGAVILISLYFMV